MSASSARASGSRPAPAWPSQPPLQRLERQLRESQRVVDLVGHPGGHGPQRGQAIGADQLRLQALALGGVADEHDRAG
jgi:hypothetical protein